MSTAPTTTWEPRVTDASVETRFDDSRCRVEVRSDGGTASVVSAARQVRQAVLDASGRGLQTVTMTLDVSSPASGAVLAQLRALAVDRVGTLRVRRAGETVLVDVDLIRKVVADDGLLTGPPRSTAPQARPRLASPLVGLLRPSTAA